MSNISEYREEIKRLYLHVFKSNLSNKDINRFIADNFLIYVDADKIVGIIRYKYINGEDEKYNRLFGISNAIFLSDMLSVKKGVGARMVNDLLSLDDTDRIEAFITIPWKNELIEYYNKFGFKELNPNDRRYPTSVMYRYTHNIIKEK